MSHQVSSHLFHYDRVCCSPGQSTRRQHLLSAHCKMTPLGNTMQFANSPSSGHILFVSFDLCRKSEFLELHPSHQLQQLKEAGRFQHCQPCTRENSLLVKPINPTTDSRDTTCADAIHCAVTHIWVFSAYKMFYLIALLSKEQHKREWPGRCVVASP